MNVARRPTPSLAAAIAATAIPAGVRVPEGGPATVARLEAALDGIDPRLTRAWHGLAAAVDAFALATTGRRFERLPLGARLDVLERFGAHEPGRTALRGLLSPLKLAHFDDAAVHSALGCRYAVDVPATDEPARWRASIVSAADVTEDLVCDVVIVGTGAGGAPLAAKLAEEGLAVLLLEEGEHHTRTSFDGRVVPRMRAMYRQGGATVAFGNTAIPIPVGRGVGGSTTINSGTCFRVPAHTLAEWREESGVADLSPQALGPYYAEVERFLEVGPSSAAALGGPARIVAQACDRLGWSHHPLARNAPGCDGQGLCCFGCPTDAKKSSNVSWVPRALSAGAQLLTGARVDRVLVEGGRAVGVACGGLEVRASAVVLACGSFGTPQLLLGQGLANRSGQVGRNLSIHPATAAIGLFDESVGGLRSVPQGYGIDEFHDEGLLFEGSSLPLELHAAMTPGFGPGWTSLLEAVDRTLVFGFMVKDRSRGRVTVGPGGSLRLAYHLEEVDLVRIRRGMGLLARMYFAGGAREVRAPVAGHEVLRSLADVRRMEAARYPARHVDLTAYHPLGTCRMGVDPGRSVVGPTHEAHDVRGLFVVDGSVFPASPGVNPQVTIMALALRAAPFVAAAAA